MSVQFVYSAFVFANEALDRGETVKYRGYVAKPSDYGFEFYHADYDGPEDGRCGTRCTAFDALEAIDDKCDDES